MVDSLWNLSFRIARGLGLGDEDAQDCAQEFVLRHLDAPDRPASWWATCARNHARDHARALRRQAARSTVLDESAEADTREGDPASALTREEVALALARALESLRPEVRIVVVRHHLEGVSVAELARDFRASKGAVEQRLHRARQSLAQRLETLREK